MFDGMTGMNTQTLVQCNKSPGSHGPKHLGRDDRTTGNQLSDHYDVVSPSCGTRQVRRAGQGRSRWVRRSTFCHSFLFLTLLPVSLTHTQRLTLELMRTTHCWRWANDATEPTKWAVWL